jgi:phage portal protein BeeE
VRMRDGNTQVTIPPRRAAPQRHEPRRLIGLSPIAYHRETIGLALAAEKYGAAFFGNNARPSGVLKVKQVLGKEATEALRKSWEEKFKGPDKRTMAVLDGEMDWTQTGMDNETRSTSRPADLSNQDIYRIYRMPPHKVGDLDKATFSNIEQQALEYVTDCLLSEMVRWEQTLRRDLLTEEEQARNISSNSCRTRCCAATSRAATRPTPSRAIGASSASTTSAIARTSTTLDERRHLPAAAEHDRGRHRRRRRRPWRRQGTARLAALVAQEDAKE